MIVMLVLLVIKPGTVSAGWSVTFENPNVCAVKGSSVKLSCSYNYTDGETVEKTAWYKGELKDGIWKRVALSTLSSYENRSEYVGDQLHDCNLAIHDVQDSDTGYYYFRFDTKKMGWRSKDSVSLTVNELRARVYPDRVTAGDRVTLECQTACQHAIMVWFKDGHPVAKPVFQAQPEDAGSYLCAVKGQQSVRSAPMSLDIQYPPLNVSIEVSYSGPLVEGSSMNLTCSSAANPAANNYTWYRGAVSSSMLQVGSGQVLSISSVEASHAGLYLCQARNHLGGSNSSEFLLKMDDRDIHRIILFVGAGVKGFIVLLIPLIIIWAWKQRRNSAVDKEEDSHDYENIDQ